MSGQSLVGGQFGSPHTSLPLDAELVPAFGLVVVHEAATATTKMPSLVIAIAGRREAAGRSKGRATPRAGW